MDELILALYNAILEGDADSTEAAVKAALGCAAHGYRQPGWQFRSGRTNSHLLTV
jgi:hypothetical protein